MQLLWVDVFSAHTAIVVRLGAQTERLRDGERQRERKADGETTKPSCPGDEE